MSTLTREAYAQLIREDLEVLNALPDTLERRHIQDVLNWSIRAAYENEAELRTKLAEVERLKEAEVKGLREQNDELKYRLRAWQDAEAERQALAAPAPKESE